MFVQTLSTPNPDSLKFIPDIEICEQGKIFEFFNNNDDAAQGKGPVRTEFVESLFAVEGVASVCVSPDFITVTKRKDSDWDDVKIEVLDVIMQTTMSGRPFVDSNFSSSNKDRSTEGEGGAQLTDIEKEIFELIDERIRPAVAVDGGDVQFVRFDAETGVLYLKMMGACSGCPSAAVTLQDGIKRMLQYYVPEVIEVVPCND